MDDSMSAVYELPESIKHRLDKLFHTYKNDKEKIRERIGIYRQYVAAGVSRKAIKGMMTSPDSQPPVLMRITATENTDTNGYTWTIPDIAVVLERHRNTVFLNINAMSEDEAYRSRLNGIRIESISPYKTKLYKYTEEIFNLLLDFYARQYIKERIIRPRHGAPMSCDREDAVWKYWEHLNSMLDYNELEVLSMLQNTAAATGSLVFEVSEIPVKLKKLLKDCVGVICSNKLLSATTALLVNFTDLQGKNIRAFYILPMVIVPMIVIMFIRARSEADSIRRKKYTSYLAYAMIAAVVWVFSFTGRALNGNLSESAIPDMVQKIERLAVQQQETAKDVAQIHTQIDKLEGKAEERAAVRRDRVIEFIDEARDFIDKASGDMSGIDAYDYEKMIAGCTSMRDTMPLDMPEERARLFIAESDIYQLWGMTDERTAYSKFGNAVSALKKASEIQNISKDSLTNIYAGMGIIYTQMGDLKSREENLSLAEAAFAKAGKYVDEADNSTKITYYIGNGSFLTAQTEAVRQDTDAALNQLNQAKESFKTAEKLAKTEGRQRALKIIRSETAIVERRTADLLSTIDSDASTKLCLASIAECEKELGTLNIEKEPYRYVFLKLRIAELSMQLYDILKDEAVNSGYREKDYLTGNIEERADILHKAYSALQQAEKFNNGEYVDQAQIYYKGALIISRHAQLLGGDKDLYDKSLALFDRALKEYPENESLLRNIEVAANKAVTLYNAGILMKNDEYIKQARRISELYLNEYSSTGYEVFLKMFRDVLSR